MTRTHDQRRVNQIKAAQVALPRLGMLADELEVLAHELFERRIAYEPTDSASVMALSFVTKQREHLRSVRLLLDAKQHRDAHLVARTMIEGLGRLLWAFSQYPKRTDLWFWYGAILDWRQTLKNEDNGISVDPAMKSELRSLVDQHGPRYYRPKVRESVEAAQLANTDFIVPEDPWGTDWTPTSIETMFLNVDGQRLYDSVYRDSSEWVHWGPRSIMTAVQTAEWGVAGFAREDWRVAAVSLQLGCQSLLQSLEILDAQFNLGVADRLSELNARMIRIQTDAVKAGWDAGQE